VRRNRHKDDAVEVTMSSLVQIVAALLVLAAFALQQAGTLTPRSLPYLLLNVVGASVLAVEGVLERQWGFLLLESVWALIAAVGLVQSLRPWAVPA